MASASKDRKVSKYAYLHKAVAGLSLVAFTSVLIAGLQAQARLTTIAWRAMIVMLIIKLAARIVIRVFETYEEMHRGKA